MLLERILQIAIAALLFLSTLMLGLGESNALFPVLALIASASSVYFTDHKRWIEIKDSTASLVAVVALVISFVEFTRLGSESQLLAITNLLVYLQCVMLYQRKSLRRYWLLILISLLEVAVASAISSELAAGVMLTAYVVLGALSLALLLVVRQAKRFGTLYRPRAVHLATTSPGTVSSALPRPGRWPLPLRAQLLSPIQNHDVREEVLTWRFIRRVLRICVGAFALTMLLFFAVPRVGRDQWKRESALLATPSRVGISERIALDELGPILESEEPVMQVRFLDATTGEDYALFDEPLYRGFVLTKYENREWTQERSSSVKPIRIVEGLNLSGLVRQQITVEPLDKNALFSVFPVVNDDPSSEVLVDSGREQLIRPSKYQDDSFSYDLLTRGLIRGRVARLIPRGYPLLAGSPRYKALSAVPWSEDSRVAVLANDLIAQLPADRRNNHYEQARMLEAYLRDPARFEYSLVPPSREPALDPVEDFLFENPRGHCEYFASALALMLRSVGIPARVVIGFKGGDYNYLGDFYQVRQLHAHAWVEAYLPYAVIPEILISENRSRYRFGAWLTLDSTPGSTAAAIAQEKAGGIPTLSDLIDYAQFAWSTYVMGMNSRRQQEAIYQPLSEGARTLARGLFGAESSGGRWQFLVESFREGRWFSWQAGLVAMVMCFLLVAFWRIGRWLIRGIIALLPERRGGPAVRSGIRVPFYQRLEKILAREKQRRSPTTTPREFAISVSTRLFANDQTQSAARIPLRVVEAFYQVRFGDRNLDERQSADIDRALDQLEGTLAENRRNGNSHNGRRIPPMPKRRQQERSNPR